jgi:hypothetical protein
MKLINIFPLGNLGMHHSQDMHMFLTHLVEKYPFYAKFARSVKGYKILDNSLIELGGSVELQRVLDAAAHIDADEIILPDVFCDGTATVRATQAAIQELRTIYPDGNFPYKIMAVAQGKDEKEWYECYKFLVNDPYIDVVGIPKVLAKKHPQGRPYFVNNLCELDKKPHHLLGLWYSTNEFNEYKHIDDIRSCDTVLLGYMAKHGLRADGVRPDGHTVDLENDVINYDNFNRRDNQRRIMK